MKFTFSIQTTRTTGAGVLGAVKPDKDGFYCGIPVTVLGVPSRNNRLYEPNSLIKCMTDPKTRFFKSLQSGGLDGEYGHPMLVNMSEAAAFQRLTIIDPKQVSHSFRRLYADTTRDGQYQIVRADIKPAGPYGEYLKACFEDPDRDTCFSMRTITTEPVMKNGIGHSNVILAVTYDYEPAPGFELASKRYVCGTESWGFEMNSDDLLKSTTESLEGSQQSMDRIGAESFTYIHQELSDMCNTDKVVTSVVKTPLGEFDTETGVLKGTYRNRSLTHHVLKGVSLC